MKIILFVCLVGVSLAMEEGCSLFGHQKKSKKNNKYRSGIESECDATEDLQYRNEDIKLREPIKNPGGEFDIDPEDPVVKRYLKIAINKEHEKTDSEPMSVVRILKIIRKDVLDPEREPAADYSMKYLSKNPGSEVMYRCEIQFTVPDSRHKPITVDLYMCKETAEYKE